jgi:hypothetical protein
LIAATVADELLSSETRPAIQFFVSVWFLRSLTWSTPPPALARDACARRALGRCEAAVTDGVAADLPSLEQQQDGVAAVRGVATGAGAGRRWQHPAAARRAAAGVPTVPPLAGPIRHTGDQRPERRAVAG